MADTAVADQTAVVENNSRMGAGKAGGRGDSSGCYFANSANGSPFMVSGELFLRSTQKLLFSSGSGSGSSDLVVVPPSSDQYLEQQRQQQPRHATAGTPHATAVSATDYPSAGLLAGLSRDLRDLLLCHPDLNESQPPPATTTTTTTEDGIGDGGLPGLVSSARAERRLVRRKRVACLETSKTIAGCLVTARLNAVQKAGERFREGCGERLAQLDTRLGSLVLR